MKYKLMAIMCWMVPLFGKVPEQIPAVQFSGSSSSSVSPASHISVLPQSIFSVIGKPEYRQDILPYDFSYLTNLLQHAKTSNQPRNYTRLTLQLYLKLVMGTPALNAYNFDEFLGQFNQVIKPCFSIRYPAQYSFITASPMQQLHIYERLQSIINPLLYTRFNESFDQFKENPINFLDNLTQECITLVRQEITIQQLRNMVVRFLETSLSKLVWSPEDGEKIWHNIKSIAHRLNQSADQGIIDDDNDLDDLLWALIYRFCYFIDLTANDLPETMLTKMKEDISSENLELCALEEQETFLETKKECLLRAITGAYAKRTAYQNGILTY